MGSQFSILAVAGVLRPSCCCYSPTLPPPSLFTTLPSLSLCTNLYAHSLPRYAYQLHFNPLITNHPTHPSSTCVSSRPSFPARPSSLLSSLSRSTPSPLEVSRLARPTPSPTRPPTTPPPPSSCARVLPATWTPSARSPVGPPLHPCHSSKC